MSLIEKAQAVVESTPTPVSFTVMFGSLFMSILQPLALVVTVVWGCLQAHGWIEKRWGRDFLYLNRLFGRKDK